MTPVALLLTLSLSSSAPVLVAVATEGFTEKDRAAVVNRVTADVEGAGVVPTLLPPGVVTAACAADAACAGKLFAGGTATRMVFVDVLRAGSRASLAARVVASSGETLAEHSAVLPMTKLLGGHEPLLPDPLLAALPTPVAAPPVTTPPPVTTTPTTVPPPPTTTTPATPAPVAPADDGAPGVLTVAGVGVGAVGALLLVGGAGVALGQNAVRLDAGADGDARAATAVTIPLSLGVAALGVVAVGVGVVMLVGLGDDVATDGVAGAGG